MFDTSLTELIQYALIQSNLEPSSKESMKQLLTAWMWECKLQGWMLDNRAVEELLQATECALDYK